MYKVQKSTLSKSLNSVISQFDLFAQQVQLRINKKDKFVTPLGIVMSIVIITISLILVINKLIGVVEKIHPAVVSSEQQDSETPVSIIFIKNFILMPNNFTFAVSLNKLSLENIYGKDTRYNLKFTYCFRNRNPETKKITQSCQDYRMNTCEDRNFQAEFQKTYFQLFNKSNIYCINYDDWVSQPFQLKGAGASNEFKYIQFTAHICDNSTSNNQCLPKDQIVTDMPGGLFVYYVQDQLLDLKEPNSIFAPTIRQGSSMFSLGTQKTVVAYHKTVYVDTDVGLFVEDFQQQVNFQSFLEKESSDAISKNTFIQYVYQLDPRQIYYNRSYQKIQDIIGTIGGLWQALYFGISFLIVPFIQGFLELSLVNRFFTFSYKTKIFEKQNSISVNKSRAVLISPPQSKSSIIKKISSQRQCQLERTSHASQIAQYLRERKAMLQLNLTDLCGFLFGSKKKEKQQFSYGQSKILQKLDITFILSKLFEMDKLKMVLLNDRQLKLFNYFPKPCVSEAIFSNGQIEESLKIQEEKPEFKYLLQEEMTQEIKIQDAYIAYKQIKKDKIQDQLDQKMMNYLDQDLKNLFDTLLDLEDSDESVIDQFSDQQQNESHYQNIDLTYTTHKKPQILANS